MGNTTKTKERSIYSIRDGVIVLASNRWEPLTFPSIEGNLEGIRQVTRSSGIVSLPQWYMDFRYGDKEFTIRLPYLSGTFKGIVMALAEYHYLSPGTTIRLTPYEKEGHTKVVINADDEAITSTTPLPPIGLREWDGVKYVSDQMKYITSLVKEINQRLGYQE